MNKIYVVTSTELGWDCVVAVFAANSVELDDLEAAYPKSFNYIIHERDLQVEIEEY